MLTSFAYCIHPHPQAFLFCTCHTLSRASESSFNFNDPRGIFGLGLNTYVSMLASCRCICLLGCLLASKLAECSCYLIPCMHSFLPLLCRRARERARERGSESRFKLILICNSRVGYLAMYICLVRVCICMYLNVCMCI